MGEVSSKERSPRVFVTGATGVIGRRLVPMLLAAGHRVTAAARSPGQRAALQAAGAASVEVDLFDADSVRAALTDHDVVVNLATHMPPSGVRMFLPGAWRQNDRVRRLGSANLVNAAIAAGARRFIQESFAPAYPDRGEDWIGEETPIQPVRYNRTIADAERSAGRFTTSGGIGIVLRFAAFYGPDADHVQDLIRFVRKGWAPLPGGPEGFVSSVSQDDAAAAVMAALQVPAGVYNVVDDEPLRRRPFYDALAAALGVPPPRLLPRWATGLFRSVGEMLARSLRISNRKLREASPWAPIYPSAREGWRATVDAIARAQPAAVPRALLGKRA
jgi:nucleoside-diphosphate-sugar epimerase